MLSLTLSILYMQYYICWYTILIPYFNLLSHVIALVSVKHELNDFCILSLAHKTERTYTNEQIYNTEQTDYNHF